MVLPFLLSILPIAFALLCGCKRITSYRANTKYSTKKGVRKLTPDYYATSQ